MNIEMLYLNKRLRKRQLDISRIKSMIELSTSSAKVIIKIPLNDDTSTVIFREIYESIRQLGDAKLWILGYEPLDHDASIEALQDSNIKNKLLLNRLFRFKRIRHDANYRGQKVSLNQAKEILDFWKEASEEIIGELKI